MNKASVDFAAASHFDGLPSVTHPLNTAERSESPGDRVPQPRHSRHVGLDNPSGGGGCAALGHASLAKSPPG